MTRMIVNGAGGRMGSLLRQLLDERGEELGFSLACGTDCGGEFPLIADCTAEADVIVDFSFHTAAPALLDYALLHSLPVVIATTGHTEDELALVRSAAQRIPVFHAANLSLGVAVLTDLAKRAAAAFPDADIEIVEAHHNRKLDAPSGTALALAQAVASVREGATVAAGRSGVGRRVPGEITVHALRMGNIPGIHEIHITTDTQQLTLRHETHSRMLLAEGAVSAARFLLGRPAGYYGMEDMLRG